MAHWPVPVFIFFVWFLWIGACAGQAAVEDARRGIPEGERRGISILPGMPVFPLAFWGAAWAVDRAVDPWGSIVVAAFHIAFGVTLIVSIVRSSRTLREMDEPT